MMILTAKVNFKKILVILLAAAVLIAGLSAWLRQDTAAPTGSGAVSTDQDRVTFLKGFGWEVAPEAKESGTVRIPGEMTEIYSRYNRLQQSQGYDLTPYRGKTALRFVYEIQNFPGATDPVYATLLVYDGRVIGGDVTDTSPKGVMQGFRMPGGAKAPGAA